MGNKHNSTQDNQSLLRNIEKYINDLQDEQTKIENIHKKLLRFLYIHAVYPFNSDIADYLQLLIGLEQMKQKAGAQNGSVIDNLVEVMSSYENEINRIKNESENDRNSKDILKSEDIFMLVGNLHRSPIHGTQLRHKINLLKISEETAVKRMEKRIKLPRKALSSDILSMLTSLISSTVTTYL